MPARDAIAGGEAQTTGLAPVVATGGLTVFRRIRPEIPASYAGDQARFDRDMQVLQVRRELLEREASVREAQAMILIHEADAEERFLRLQADAQAVSEGHPLRPALTPAQRRRINGQALLARARAEYAQERILQLTLEAQAWAATLTKPKRARRRTAAERSV